MAASRFVFRQPQGQATRGKTAANRLRRVDTFALRYAGHLLKLTEGAFADAAVVDLGYGSDPTTTLEMGARFRKVNPGLRVIGVEIDRERVAAAQPFAGERTSFRLGGFNLPLKPLPGGRHESARLIRAFNVLRQYQEGDVLPAWRLMAGSLLEGGLLIEGTSDPSGRRWVAEVVRKAPAGLVAEALVCSQSFRVPIDLGSFQAVLPKRHIHRMIAGEPIEAFFTAWRAALAETVHWRTWGERGWFAAAGEALAARGYTIDQRRSTLRDGYLVWLNPPALGR